MGDRGWFSSTSSMGMAVTSTGQGVPGLLYLDADSGRSAEFDIGEDVQKASRDYEFCEYCGTPYRVDYKGVPVDRLTCSECGGHLVEEDEEE